MFLFLVMIMKTRRGRFAYVVRKLVWTFDLCHQNRINGHNVDMISIFQGNVSYATIVLSFCRYHLFVVSMV